MSHPDDLTLQCLHDGELDESRHAEISEHLAGCSACLARVESLRVTSAAVSQWLDAAPALPDDFADAVLSRAQSENSGAVRAVPSPPQVSERPAAKVIPLRRWVWSGVAVAAAGLFALSVSLPNRPVGGRPPTEAVNDRGGGAKVTRVDIPGAQSFTVMQLPGMRPDTVTAVVWIQDADEGGGSP